jgi:hypothetical protein
VAETGPASYCSRIHTIDSGDGGAGRADGVADGAVARQYDSCRRDSVGPQGRPRGPDLHVNERTIGEPFNEPIEVPVLVGDVAKMAARIKPTNSPLTFRTEGLGRPAEVTLVPYYRIAHEHYNLYWRIVDA